MILTTVNAENNGQWMEVLKGDPKIEKNEDKWWGKDKSLANNIFNLHWMVSLKT